MALILISSWYDKSHLQDTKNDTHLQTAAEQIKARRGNKSYRNLNSNSQSFRQNILQREMTMVEESLPMVFRGDSLYGINLFAR